MKAKDFLLEYNRQLAIQNWEKQIEMATKYDLTVNQASPKMVAQALGILTSETPAAKPRVRASAR
jgi:hypothetical protein